jgi:hypothetical protein
VALLFGGLVAIGCHGEGVSMSRKRTLEDPYPTTLDGVREELEVE